MSRDALFHDLRSGLHEESRSSNGRTDSRLTEPSRDVEESPANRQIDNPRPQVTQRKPEALDTPRAHYLGDRACLLRESELQTLIEVGTFRAVAAIDLASISYGGDTRRMERDIRRLKEQSFVSEKVLRADRNHVIRLFALTKKGARLARSSGVVPEAQVIYHGFVKPHEAKHDADLYRLYQAQAERIEAAGGRVARVILDYELKRNLNRELALAPEEQSEEVRERIAERHGLSLVNGKIPVPDMRLEYDSAEMERKHLDLELATRNYRPRALAEKAKAGFSLYALREDASRLRRILDEREITREIFSL